MSDKFHSDAQECFGESRPATGIRTKKVAWTTFHLLNGDLQPVIGDKYLVARTTGAVEPWVLMHIDQPNRMLMFMCC